MTDMLYCLLDVEYLPTILMSSSFNYSRNVIVTVTGVMNSSHTKDFLNEKNNLGSISILNRI
jgi:hypothetical protein